MVAPSATHLFRPLPVSWTVNHPCLYSPTELAALSVTCLYTPLPCQLNCQSPIPTLSVAPLITHPLNPVSCWLHQLSCISLLTPLGRWAVNQSCLYSLTLSAGLSVAHLFSPLLCWLHRQSHCSPTLLVAPSVTHLFTPLLCQLNCQPAMSVLTHTFSCTFSHPSLYSPTLSAAPTEIGRAHV